MEININGIPGIDKPNLKQNIYLLQHKWVGTRKALKLYH